MASQKQIEANCRNAQKSTGPKTAEGKSIASQNSLKHGLRSDCVLIASDNPDEFNAHRSALLEDLAPIGPMEIYLAERIVKLTWQLSRAAAFQSESIDTLIEPEKDQQPQQRPSDRVPAWAYYGDDFTRRIGIATTKQYHYLIDAGILSHYVDNWAWKRPQKFERLLKEFGFCDDSDSQPVNERRDGLLSLGEVAVNDFSNTRVLERLAMYERRIESSLFKTQLQLERLQLRRKTNEQKNAIPSEAEELSTNNELRTTN